MKYKDLKPGDLFRFVTDRHGAVRLRLCDGTLREGVVCGYVVIHKAAGIVPASGYPMDDAYASDLEVVLLDAEFTDRLTHLTWPDLEPGEFFRFSDAREAYLAQRVDGGYRCVRTGYSDLPSGGGTIYSNGGRKIVRLRPVVDALASEVLIGEEFTYHGDRYRRIHGSFVAIKTLSGSWLPVLNLDTNRVDGIHRDQRVEASTTFGNLKVGDLFRYPEQGEEVVLQKIEEDTCRCALSAADFAAIVRHDVPVLRLKFEEEE